MSWTAVREVFPYERITYKHIKGFATGMDVSWSFKPIQEGVAVVITHDFSLSWPLLGDFVSRYIVGALFVKPIASRTLRHLKQTVGLGRSLAAVLGDTVNRGRQRRFVITGIGAVTPIGHGREGLWRGVLRGKSAVRRVSAFDVDAYRCQVAAEVRDFDPTPYLDKKQLKRLDRYSQFAVCAAKMAVADAYLRCGAP